MFVPVFTLNLNQKLLPGRVSIGSFDGERPCLVAATVAEKVTHIRVIFSQAAVITICIAQVFIHTPNAQMGGNTGRIFTGGGSGGIIGGAPGTNSDLVMLNINQRVTAVATGRLDPEVDRDYLLVGTPTNLLVYDVEKNADIFHKASEYRIHVVFDFWQCRFWTLHSCPGRTWQTGRTPSPWDTSAAA